MLQPDEEAPTLADAVAKRLRHAIVSGEFSPGERLTESKVAALVEASRTPVAAALKKLTEQGLVRYEQNRGYWVREISVDEVMAAYEIRATLEGLACRRAAEIGAPNAAMKTLRDCLEIGEAITQGDTLDDDQHGPYQEMNARFHATIIEISGNPALPRFVRECHELPFGSDRIVFWRSPEIVRRSHLDHVRIVASIANREGARAEMQMREHVYEAGAVLRDHWDEIARSRRLVAPKDP